MENEQQELQEQQEQKQVKDTGTSDDVEVLTKAEIIKIIDDKIGEWFDKIQFVESNKDDAESPKSASVELK